MLDFRHETFLVLCRLGSYTKTAEELHMTQPAVTQHIKYLEQMYGCKLLHYDARALTLTHAGQILRQFASTMRADSNRLAKIMSEANEAQTPLCFGATLTIGEYAMPKVLAKLLPENPKRKITMLVDNTEMLLQRLREGEIDFALLEGVFDKEKYAHELLSKEAFIPVCAKGMFENKSLEMAEILPQSLILREKGSGTRDILEQVLREENLGINAFGSVCEIGNMSVIKQLVAKGLGITFLYKIAALAELENGTLEEINLRGFSAYREFNFVYLKNSLHREEYTTVFNAIKGDYNADKP
ncbi:MAG: LysR family transcriptional regulator [Oscillospiraceae bacterium]